MFAQPGATLGSVFLGGTYAGTISFGSVTHASSSLHDVLVAKFAPDMTLRWSKSFGASYDDIISKMVVGKDGNVVGVGAFASTSITFGGAPLSGDGDGDLFVVKLDGETGVHLWSHGFTGGPVVAAASITAVSVALDPQDNVIIAGDLKGAISMDGLPLDNAPDKCLFVAKLSPDGSLVWFKAFGDGAGTDTFPDPRIATDSQGRILIACHCAGASDFGGGRLESPDVLVLDADGNYVWSRQVRRVVIGTGGYVGQLEINAIAATPEDDVIIGGNYSGTFDFGDRTSTAVEFDPWGPAPPTPTPDNFIAKLAK